MFRLSTPALAAVLCTLAPTLVKAQGAEPKAAAGAASDAIRLRERFGVPHPLQLVEFDVGGQKLAQPAGVLRSKQQVTPYQQLANGKVVLLTGLPAGSDFEWPLATAAAAPDGAIPNPVVVTKEDKTYRIENGLTGVAIPAEGSTAQLAPLQGIRYRDGTWTATGPNLLKSPLKDFRLRWVEQGPLKVVAELSYTGAAGQSFKSTIEVQASQPSVLIEDEATVNVEYAFNVAPGLEPDEGRYHVERGERVVKLDVGKQKKYGRMAIWDPWAQQQNRGDGWQLYNTRAGADANLFALFPGRASRIIQGNRGGPEVFTAPADATGKPVAGVTVAHQGAGHKLGVRIPWNIFVGVKGKDWNPRPDFVDTNDPRRIQGYVKQYNLHSGINLNKLLSYQLEDYPDPLRGYGSMYMPPEALTATVDRLRKDKVFFDHLYADGYTRPLFDMWRSGNPQSVKQVVDGILRQVSPYPTSAFNALNGYVNGWGFWNPHYAYWVGGGNMANKFIWIDQVLARKDLSVDDRRSIKATAALFGGILWDDDFVPLSIAHVSGLNLGTPNMPVQQTGMRHQAALFLSEHPLMKPRLADVAAAARGQLHGQVNEHGAHMGCPHYIGAAAWPTLNTLLQLKQAKVADLFATDERLRKFAEFQMQLATPPDPRTGNRRHQIAVGDSEVDDNLLLAGLLATGYRDIDPELAGRLMGLWDQSGRPHNAFYGTTVVKIDERIAPRDARLTSADFPGYLSVFRSGWGTQHESAMWFINGDYYRDHYHNDKGEVILYAHGAPLSLDFGSMYSPRSAGGMMKNRLLPANLNWKASPASVPEEAGNWGNSRSFDFQSLASGGHGSASFKGYGGDWTRSVSLAETTPGQPVFVIQDQFTRGPMVFSLNLMCADAIETSEGQKKPGESFTLKAGVNRLTCKGQAFPSHFSKGIDWDVFVVSTEPQEAALSEWSHKNRLPERQAILRVQGAKEFQVVIVPYPKGQKPADVEVQVKDGQLVVAVQGKSVSFDRAGKFTANP